MRWLLLLAMTSTTLAHADPRTDFAAKLARVKLGMTAAEVTKLLGSPDDVKTEKDPGGITAARTTQVWRYGAAGHLKVATLGQVHIQADNTVQYVFGGKGTALVGVPEQALRGVMQRLDDVPSYNAPLDPLRLVRAVNALHALGKDKALAVIDEYLRVTSPFDDPGRDGVFLVLRVLFDAPAMPPMLVGAASPAPDAKRFPRHPIVMVGDLPLKIVTGYALAGHPQDPESDVAAFRKVGVLRAKPLAPSPTSLAALDAFFATPAGKLVDRAYVSDQALRFFGTVYRPANRTIDTWHPDPALWSAHVAAIARIKPTWNAISQQMEHDGTVLPPLPGPSARVWWDLGLAGAHASRITFERLDDDVVAVELRIDAKVGVAPDTLRVVDAKTSKQLTKLDVKASAGGTASTWRLKLTKGQAVRVELGSGARSPVLTP